MNRAIYQQMVRRLDSTPSGDPDFIMLVKTDNSGTSGNNQFTIHTAGFGYNYEVETSEQLLSNQTGSVTLQWSTAGTYEVRIRGAFPRIHFNNRGDRQKLLEIQNWGDIEWSSMLSAFRGCNNLILTATDVPDLSGVTDMREMFNVASSFNGDLSGWDVSGAVFLNSMFNGASSFNGDISGWDVSGAANMGFMFQNASSFNQDISGWDVSGVANMGAMFRNASSFNQDLSGWCVEQFSSEPSNFATGATAWTLPKPNWGDPC
jgi:surface protein